MTARLLRLPTTLLVAAVLAVSVSGTRAAEQASYATTAAYPDSTSRLEVDLNPAAVKRPGYDALTAVKWRLYTPLVRSRYCEIAPQGMITITGPKTKDFPAGAHYKLPFTAVLPVEGKRHTVHYTFRPPTFVPTMPSGFIPKRATITLVWLVRTFSKPCATARTHLDPKHTVAVQLP